MSEIYFKLKIPFFRFANSSSQIISNEPNTLEVANVIEKVTEFTLPDIPTNIASDENEGETGILAQPTNADSIDDQPDILHASASAIPDDVKIHQVITNYLLK